MSLIQINRNPTSRELRQFAGIWFPAFWAIIGALLWFKAGFHAAGVAVWSAAGVVSIAGLARPALIRPIFVGMCVASAPIGYVVSLILVASIYYLVLTPTGLLLRLFRYDPMQRRFDRSASSYWVPYEAGADVKRYFRQF